MSYKKISKPYHYRKPQNDAASPEIIEFRLLCRTSAAGGVIGRSGIVIKNLEKDTTTNIWFDDVVSSTCKDRIVHITGSSTLNRKFMFSGKEVVVSASQEALLKVFDRMGEVDSQDVEGGMVRCRLLVGPGLVGAVMGAGGTKIAKITKESGGFIKIFGSSELLPPCARPSDEMILISGGRLAVKKALLAVSQCIQQKITQFLEGTNGASMVLRPSIKMETGDASAIDGRVNEGAVAEVVFKLLCSWDAAGAVIGFRGRRVKALEEETAATIQFSAAEDGCNERIVTVSAFENRNSCHSSAQHALVRVFNGLMSSEENANVTARLLIQPSQSCYLNVIKDSINTCIPKETGATLQMLEHNYSHAGASDEKVIQIDGEHSSVQIALFQVSWMLRECIFDAVLVKNDSPLLPHKLFNLPPYLNDRAAFTKKMKNCRVTEEVNGSLPSYVQKSELSNGHCFSVLSKHPKDSTTVNGGAEHGSSSRSVIVTNKKMEIDVRADVFSSIFGDDGSNLSRLRMISGAKVEAQDHCPGSDGKIFISGTPDQTLAAQSLLQALSWLLSDCLRL